MAFLLHANSSFVSSRWKHYFNKRCAGRGTMVTVKATGTTTAAAAVAVIGDSNQAPPSHVINFGCGHPDSSLLPAQLVADATQRALLGDHDDSNGREWLQYARGSGSLPACQALANFLTELYYPTNTDTHTNSNPASREVVEPHTLFFTSGVSHGIQLTCRTLARMHSSTKSATEAMGKPLCLVEDPTYFLVPAIFRQSGYDLQPVLTRRSHGLDVQELQTILEQIRTKSPDRLIVLYTIPVHHNPLGASLSEDDRQTLVRLCETFQLFVIADEVYQGLTFLDNDAATTIHAPMALRSSRIISVGAFTKILCPGIRCGWIQTLDTALLEAIGQDGVLDSGGCSSQLSSGIVMNMMTRHVHDEEEPALATYMTFLQKEYANRCRHLCKLLQDASLDSSTDYGFDFHTPHGGYFLWVTLTGVNFDVDEYFRSFCRTNHDVDFKTGMSCSSATSSELTPFAKSMRLCFAFYDVSELTKGVDRLCRAIQAYAKQSDRILSSE